MYFDSLLTKIMTGKYWQLLGDANISEHIGRPELIYAWIYKFANSNVVRDFQFERENQVRHLIVYDREVTGRIMGFFRVPCIILRLTLS